MSDVGLAVLHVPDKKAFDHLVTVSTKLWMLHFCVPAKPVVVITLSCFSLSFHGAAVAEWLSSWLAEQEVRGSNPGLAT